MFRQIPAVAGQRYVTADGPTIAALRIPGVLSGPYALDMLVPKLRSAVP